MPEPITLVCRTCSLEFVFPENQALHDCPACGTPHSRPRARAQALIDLRRAHQQRAACDFLNAAQSYQLVLQAAPDEAEALWGLALCKYGVEYVLDEKSGQHLPTIHFLNRRPFAEDPDCRLAIARADAQLRPGYQRDAEYISRIQQEVLSAEMRGVECDVFLCYKASIPGSADPNARTREFLHAQDLYIALRDAGLRVFFAHQSLRQAAGANYEAQIFHALQSARAMLVVTSDPAHLLTPWVHSEWSRYLERIDGGESCRLIPLLYDGCDPYTLPDAFLRRSIQGLKMGTLTALDDLRSILEKDGAARRPAVQESAAAAPAVEPLLRRAFLFLEDGDWQSADEYCERVLDADPENARAYLGKLMASLKAPRQEQLRDQAQPFDRHPAYIKALRFADAPLAAELKGMNEHILKRNARAEKEAAYQRAEQTLARARTEQDFIDAQNRFASLGDWKDASEKAKQCEEARLDFIYQLATTALRNAKSTLGYEDARKHFESLGDYKDAPKKAKQCEEARLDFVYQLATTALRNAKSTLGCEDARKHFESLGDYKDAPDQVIRCNEKLEALAKDGIYARAYSYMKNSPNAVTLKEAIRLFQQIPGWNDADAQAELCQKKIDELQIKAKADLERAQQAAKRRNRNIGIGTAVLAAVVAVVLLVTQVIIPSRRYNAAVALMNDGQYSEAIQAFEAMDGYRDSQTQIENCYAQWREFAMCNVIAAGYHHTVGLQADGTVVAAGSNYYGQCAVSGWKDIVAIAAGNCHTVGLRADGTVVAVGNNGYGQCDVSGWKDIVAIAAGLWHTVGLRADGTVVAVGYNGYGQCDTTNWTNIIAIAAVYQHTVGLRADGTVVAVGYNGYGQCDTTTWKDIVAIAAGDYHTVGLRADGTVVAVGNNSYGQSAVSQWTDIVAIAAGASHTVGLRTDGTVVAVGYNDDGQCDTAGWKDIVSIAAGVSHTVGLRADGTVVAVGYNGDGQCDVSDWHLKQVSRPTLAK